MPPVATSNDGFPSTTLSLSSKGRAEEIEAILKAKREAARSPQVATSDKFSSQLPTLEQLEDRAEAEWLASQPHKHTDSPAKQNQSSGSRSRLTPTGWITSAGLILLLGIFLFPPWLGVEQLPREPDTTRSMGRHNIFTQPSPQLVRARLATGEEIPQNLWGRFYFAKIDYARWWTEMFVCVATAGAIMVVVRSLRPVQRG